MINFVIINLGNIKYNIIFLLLSIANIQFCFGNINNKDKTYLVFGGSTGWIGGKIVKLLKDNCNKVYCAKSRLENREQIEKELLDIKPNYVINCAGVTGRPNIDWCEDHTQETIRANIIGALNLADLCFIHNIHMTNMGTGCIYEYDNTHEINSGNGFTELDEPNFQGSFYSKTKIMLDKLLQNYPNVLNLRLRMPISDDLHDRSFITKITKYKKVINIPNSMTILYDLLPIVIEMTKRELKGNYNFVNPGVISHNEILTLYKKYIDPNFSWENFSMEEQDQILKAKRSNNELNTNKLLKEFPNIPNIKTSIVNVFKRMKGNVLKR